MLTFSLIIPTLNAANHFPALMNAIKGQSLQPCEIIIIDSSSSDKTANIAKDYGCRVKTISRESFDHGGTRTLASQMAQGEIVLFLTQDALPADNHAFKRLIECFVDTRTAAAYGRQLPYPSATVWGRSLRLFNYDEKSHLRTLDEKKFYGLKTAFLSNSFCAYRTSALQEIGYFKDNLILGEDMIAGALLLKKEYALAYEAEAHVYHSHDYTLWQEFKRYFDIGVLHRNESWLLEEFGKIEGEGLHYVLSELRFLISNHKSYLIFYSLLRNFAKYIGYKLGKIHSLLPIRVVKHMSMHHGWWNKMRIYY